MPSRHLRRLVALAFAARLALAPLAFADRPEPDAAPIRAVAAREAAQLARASARGPMPGGLKWTGIGLLAVAGLPIYLGNFGDCVPDEFSCRDQRHAAYAATGVLAGTGALLLIIANAKRSPAMPTLVLRDGRAVIQQRITF